MPHIYTSLLSPKDEHAFKMVFTKINIVPLRMQYKAKSVSYGLFASPNCPFQAPLSKSFHPFFLSLFFKHTSLAAVCTHTL